MNWGNRLLIVFIVFALGMFYLVYRSVGSSSELVEADYYQQELSYQSQLDASVRGVRSGGVQVNEQHGSIELIWPSSQTRSSLKGEAWFYCAYDKNRDRRVAFETTNGHQWIDPKRMAPGRYTMKLRWNDGSNDYYQESNIAISE